MLNTHIPERVYLACGSTDMRKSIDGLTAIVSCQFKLDPFSDCMFVFCNRGRNKLKILHWDCNGFWLYYRRPEKGRFKWPGAGEAQTLGVYAVANTLGVSRRQLLWLLDGLTLEQTQAHSEVFTRKNSLKMECICSAKSRNYMSVCLSSIYGNCGPGKRNSWSEV